MSDLNSVIVRKAYEDFAQGNIPSVFAAFDAGITWHVPGHSPLSGDYTGHDQVGGFFQRTMELSGGAFSMDVHNVLAEDNLVVALVTVNAERNGFSASFPERSISSERASDDRSIEIGRLSEQAGERSERRSLRGLIEPSERAVKRNERAAIERASEGE